MIDKSTIALDEFLVAYLVIASRPDADMEAAIETLRVLRDNVAPVADPHGAAMDEQVGSNRATAIAQEAVAMNHIGHTSHTRNTPGVSRIPDTFALASVFNRKDGDPSTGRAPTLSAQESLLAALLGHRRTRVPCSRAGLDVPTGDGAPGVTAPGAAARLCSHGGVLLPDPVEAESRLSTRPSLRMASEYERTLTRRGKTRPAFRKSRVCGTGWCKWPPRLGVAR